jgi:hypothetical protein
VFERNGDDAHVQIWRSEIAAAVRAAVAEEREAIARMIEDYRTTDDDGNRLHDLGEWDGEWFELDSEKIAAAIRSRP